MGAAPSPPCMPAPQDSQKALDLHNAARARRGARPLSWSASLAGSAQSWSSNCVFQASTHLPIQLLRHLHACLAAALALHALKWLPQKPSPLMQV